jgi:hypothetical protein
VGKVDAIELNSSKPYSSESNSNECLPHDIEYNRT